VILRGINDFFGGCGLPGKDQWHISVVVEQGNNTQNPPIDLVRKIRTLDKTTSQDELICPRSKVK
jgi:hypothetical protein